MLLGRFDFDLIYIPFYFFPVIAKHLIYMCKYENDLSCKDIFCGC